MDQLFLSGLVLLAFPVLPSYIFFAVSAKGMFLRQQPGYYKNLIIIQYNTGKLQNVISLVYFLPGGTGDIIFFSFATFPSRGIRPRGYLFLWRLSGIYGNIGLSIVVWLILHDSALVGNRKWRSPPLSSTSRGRKKLVSSFTGM